MHKWRGWISVHKGDGGKVGDTLAVSPAFEFETEFDHTMLAEEQLRAVWERAGRPVDNEVTYSPTTTYPNLERVPR